jgi:DNA-directed RNA polymerase subunit N (RpoN/RPB10)
MLYLKCPSCRELLANRQLIYEAGMNEICNSNDDEKVKDEKKTELLDRMNLKRYCCRMRLMTYRKLIDIVK